MHPGLWIAKTGLDAQKTKIAVISNNLANVGTMGFKKQDAVFSDLLYQVVSQPGGQSSQNSQLPSGLTLGTGVRVVGTEKNYSQGNLVQTEAGLDLAINGKGFFQILLPSGDTAYTRAGQFQLNNQGQLVTSQGYQLQPTITIPSTAQSVTIGTDGVVSVTTQGSPTPTQVGTITTYSFINEGGLQNIGDNLVLETASSGAPASGTPGANGFGSLLQGQLESSNVNIVEELVGLIETQRSYEMNSKVISTIDSMLQHTNQTL